MKEKILLLEDDANLGTIIQEHLEMNGYAVLRCTDGESGLEAFGKDSFHLCLVDVMMPRMDGFSFARELRRISDRVPLIFLTARSLKEDKVEGFRIGCDDYITKPFSVEELLLRVKAVLRRSAKDEPIGNKEIYEIGSCTFDSKRQQLTTPRKEYRLTPKEAELLELLSQHINRTLSREMALRRVWGEENYFSGRSMDVFVSKLRKYLHDDSRIELMTVRGKGLKLIVN